MKPDSPPSFSLLLPKKLYKNEIVDILTSNLQKSILESTFFFRA